MSDQEVTARIVIQAARIGVHVASTELRARKFSVHLHCTFILCLCDQTQSKSSPQSLHAGPSLPLETPSMKGKAASAKAKAATKKIGDGVVKGRSLKIKKALVGPDLDKKVELEKKN